MWLWGLGIGTLVSAVAWGLGWNALDRSGAGGILVWLIPTAKLVAGFACFPIPGWRSFGVGLILSIAVGFLIFFGSCFMHLAL
jgi:hypothetical protein